MSETNSTRRNLRILLLNPNSSSAMTEGMATAVRKLGLPESIEIATYTAPQHAPASIDNQQDLDASTQAVLDDTELSQDLESDKYDAILVACFSVHPLVAKLMRYQHLAVTGIFEASVLTTLSLIPAPVYGDRWGIVTTGKFWEQHLSNGVKKLLGQDPSSDNNRFSGVFSTGLNAGDFHHVSPEEVRKKLREATHQLLAPGDVACVLMGCGGMAGLEDIIRSTAVELYGKAEGDRVYIIDGVKAGVMQLEQAIRSKRAFR